MKILGLEITRAKAAVAPTTVPAAAVGSGSSWVGVIRESFAGAWQRGVEIGPTHGLLAFSALYSCIDLISADVAKLRLKLVGLNDGIWVETADPAFSPVLRKPNGYQTRIQFLESWVACKLIHGNTFVLKQRDSRGVVIGLHVLNPRMVKVMVAEDGSVFYQLSRDKLAGMTDSPTVPADEIIHDRAICFFHPLIGVPPIFACGLSATQANKIQSNSTKFFENMSRPSGQLTAPGLITDETAARLKREFETNFGGENIGRLLVTGDGLKYEPMGTIPAQQSQLIEQLKWTVEDVARCFHVPLHKIASDTGVKYANMAEMNQDYYEQCLQRIIESIELLLDEGLGLPPRLGVELDLDGLLRLNPVQRAAVNESGVKAGVVSPNEARRALNLPKVAGGEQPYMQQQQFPLAVLAQQPAPGAGAAASSKTMASVVASLESTAMKLSRRLDREGATA